MQVQQRQRRQPAQGHQRARAQHPQEVDGRPSTDDEVVPRFRAVLRQVYAEWTLIYSLLKYVQK